ncbi:MAG: sigma 54-interacting transcriptional regulator [Polyangiales bacterium]
MSARLATIHTESIPGLSGRPECVVAVIEGPDQGATAVIPYEGEVTVGTDAGCALRLTDGRVSHRHLTIRLTADGLVVTDLGSTNGVRFEGSAITEARVPFGATLGVGRSFLRVQPRAVAVEVAPSRARRFGGLVGESLAMREVFAVLELAAQRDVTVLVEGETGTGKELVARALHDEGPRRRAPFVAVDCGALPESLLESELFGHVRGAFTGASHPRQGAFARAHGGTLFLDELGGVSATVQARLLRVLEAREVRPVGSDVPRAVDVRVVAASRHDLSAAVAEGSFRPDLYYRLSVLRVSLPPLRARREDIAPIVSELLRQRGFEPGPVDGPSLDLLRGHDWPGNARELRNVIERALAMSPGAGAFRELRVAPPGQPAAVVAGEGPRLDLSWADARALALHGFERAYLTALMERHGGNLSAASRACSLDRKHLRELLRRHGVLSRGG